MRAVIENAIREHELLGDVTRDQLLYFPTVTREAFAHRGRLTDLLESGELAREVGLPPLDPSDDRFMICGSAAMLKDSAALLDRNGFVVSPSLGEPGDYVIERAFVEK